MWVLARCSISIVKTTEKKNTLLDEIGPSVDRHAQLVQYIHQVGYEISDRHRKTIPWREKLVRIQESRFGPVINHCEPQAATQCRKMASLHGFIIDGGGDHFRFEVLKSSTRVYTQEVLEFSVAD